MSDDVPMLPASADSSDQNMPQKIRLDIREAQTSVIKSTQVSLLIGRYNQQRPVDVDLTQYDGVDFGISRQHAEIIPRDGKLFIKDLDTVNGTHLNKERLKPGHLYELNDGDELKLGVMHIQVIFLW